MENTPNTSHKIEWDVAFHKNLNKTVLKRIFGYTGYGIHWNQLRKWQISGWNRLKYKMKWRNYIEALFATPTYWIFYIRALTEHRPIIPISDVSPPPALVVTLVCCWRSSEFSEGEELPIRQLLWWWLREWLHQWQGLQSGQPDVRWHPASFSSWKQTSHHCTGRVSPQ